MQTTTRYLCASLLSLVTLSAEAATVDKFKCTMQLIGWDHDDRLKTVVETAGVRQAYSSDNWTPGVEGTRAEVEIEIADLEDESVGYKLYISYEHAFNARGTGEQKAVQQTCVREEGWQGDLAWASSCAMLMPIPPYNPLNYWTRVDMDFNGPEFRSQDIIPISYDYSNHPRWRRAEGNCQFLGTEY